jgi:hypothetical protein
MTDGNGGRWRPARVERKNEVAGRRRRKRRRGRRLTGGGGGGFRTAFAGGVQLLYARAHGDCRRRPGNQWVSVTWRPRDRQVGPIVRLVFQFK